VSGDRVKAVQQRLRAQGYSSVAVTGRFDAATLVATKRFQARLGQRADGLVTWSTWAGLVDHGVVARIS
jgi:peptidoglycan hydrolase-like protein with peptidoglycan-binding domain